MAQNVMKGKQLLHEVLFHVLHTIPLVKPAIRFSMVMLCMTLFKSSLAFAVRSSARVRSNVVRVDTSS